MLIFNIDDDKEDQQIFCEALALIDASVDCICANDANEAMDMLSRMAPLPDYIFTDLNMPRMGGREFLRFLKTHSKYKDIPVIILSTGIRKEDELEFGKLGARKVFPKPSTFNDLVTMIKLTIG
jgi:CheY-like chemotaxis protein